MNNTNNRGGPLAAFAILALIWGYNWVVMKLALRYCGPFAFSAWRVAPGALLLLGVMIALRVPLKPRHVGKTILVGIFQTAAFVGLISWSLTLGAAGKSAVLAYTMPFWVIVLSWPFLGERLRGWQWPAVGLALIGLLLVLHVWNIGAGLANSSLAIASGISWGISVIIVKKIPVNGRDELLSLTTWQMLFGAVPLILIAWLVPEQPIVWSAYFIGALAFNVIAGTIIGWLLWLYVLQRLPANISGLSTLIIPVVGVISAWLQLGERPDFAEGLGIILIIVALGLLGVAGRKHSAP